MPGQFFIKVIAQKKTYIQTVAAEAQQSPVAVDIIEISDEKDFEKYHRIDALLTFFAVIVSGGFVEEILRKFALYFPVKIIFGYQCIQTKLVEDFRCVFFLSLHMLI